MGDKGPKQVAKLRGQKRVAASAETSERRRVASSPDTNPGHTIPMRFRFNRVDLGGPWCLTAITAEDHRTLIEFMASVETITVREAIPSICKREDVAGASPNSEAQRRAQVQYPTDHERIHCLHINGLKRLWGLLFDHEFSVIWWDPDHEVWPSTLKHT